MGGFFGVVSADDCTADLFYGTDYHSHLGTKRGGLAVRNAKGFVRFIHDITNAQFKSKFENDIAKLNGSMGIGIISDYEDQPLLICSHLGNYAIVTVGVIKNLEQLAKEAFRDRLTHFSEMSGGEINPTELVATIINSGGSFAEGIRKAQLKIEGSCSILLLTEKGIYAARDYMGRTPAILGKKEGSIAVTMDTCAFPNLDFQVDRYLGPGEVVFISENGVETIIEPEGKMRICAFLWVYYGYPASSYEKINVEEVRYRCGKALAMADDTRVDIVGGIPDSGTGHAIGYANEAGIPYSRPFVKYTPTWARSFMPQNQEHRNLVARMKLIPIREIIEGKRILFCDDSIVRGTQLRDIVDRLYEYGAPEVHMRPACPPLVFGCRYLNFSRSASELDLAARKEIRSLEGSADKHLDQYSDPKTEKYCAMVKNIGKKLNLTSLKYQTLDDLVSAIGLPAEKLCTYCWNGKE
ncbi:MAG: amidophosphoribosyltransferase [Spirochaetales bacterium]|nr:amidophosphoribosyltransferase [Spirochaetales bacterium]